MPILMKLPSEDAINTILKGRFSEELANTAYRNDHEYMEDLFALLSMALASAVSCRQLSERENIPLYDPHLAATADEALDYLMEYPVASSALGDGISKVMRIGKEHISGRLDKTRDSAVHLRLERLRELFALSDFSMFCLVCALANETNRSFEQAFAVMNGQVGTSCPTLGTAYAVYRFYEPNEVSDNRFYDPSSHENRLLFMDTMGGLPLVRPLMLRPQVSAWLLGRSWRSARVSRFTTPIVATPHLQDTIFCVEQVDWVCRALRLPAANRPVILLHGNDGSGRRMALELAAQELGLRFLHIEAAALKNIDEIAPELILTVLLEQWQPVITLEKGNDEELFAGLMYWFDLYGIVPVLRSETLRSRPEGTGHPVVIVEFPKISGMQRIQVWRHFSRGMSVSPDLNWEHIAAKYSLTPGQVRASLITASLIALTEDTPIDDGIIGMAVFYGNKGKLGEIASEIPIVYSWDDLVLSEAALQTLKTACDRIKYRYQVETVWGFSRKTAFSRGMSILLYGPPGTGKTMSAQAIAGELGLPLYRIDISQMISKYIGETAKNIDQVFREAKSANVILFFDEADSLFARRTEVKNSNDRHANSESAYLLQKIEDYSGISILATNLMSNFDEAFRRRIHFVVNIGMPSPTQRLALWKNMFPPEAPIASDLDFQILADSLELSGSVIKNASIQAAYYAAENQQEIGMRHVLRAVRTEMEKLGLPFPNALRWYQ